MVIPPRVLDMRKGEIAEHLAHWFLRLNGFFTMPNFIVHPNDGGGMRTEVDVIGLRLPFRAELEDSDNPLDDHPNFDRYPVTLCLLVEAKAGKPCTLNSPWLDSEKKNMERVLSAIGGFCRDRRDEIARHLYDRGFFDGSDQMHVGLCAIGESRSKLTAAQAIQLEWADVLRWIHHRASIHEQQKKNRSLWDEFGKALFDTADRSNNNCDRFTAEWLKAISPTPGTTP